LAELNADLQKYQALIELCEQKKQYHFNRLIKLEGELDFIMKDDVSLPSQRFNALLSFKPG